MRGGEGREGKQKRRGAEEEKREGGGERGGGNKEGRTGRGKEEDEEKREGERRGGGREGGTRELGEEKQEVLSQIVKYHTQVFKGHCSTLRGCVVLKQHCSFGIQACLQEVYCPSYVAMEDVSAHENERETERENCTLV